MLVVACMDVGTRAMQEHIAGPSFFKGVTINAKMRLDHELLSSPEPHILKWLGYMFIGSILLASAFQFQKLKTKNCPVLK
ncbi:hypothetical protein [Pseudoalteromonas sp. NBT06-2]|uniref:hypothetical protein n=1 Tax=Pseudoalteromonas sp. NBT06-2 TaxID=2025950 RepID=UPI0014830293|nr:hypothetical protein [Pseudoalteromonas sp. NBT06-2]